MTIFFVDGKEKTAALHDDIIDTVGAAPVLLDVGAGDGKGSLRYARAHGNEYVIALDSSPDALVKTSKTASRKPDRGGVTNFTCLYGNIREAGETLNSVADHIRVILPWGDLLEGVAELDPLIMAPLVSCAKPGSHITFIINAEIWKSNLPKRLEHLGEVTPDFFLSRSDAFSHLGIEISEAHLMSLDEIKEIDTTWSAKLMSSRSMADFVMATGVVHQNVS